MATEIVSITNLAATSELSSTDMLYVVKNTDSGLSSMKTDVDGLYNGIKNTLLNDDSFLANILSQPALVGSEKFIDYSMISTLAAVLPETNTSYTLPSDCVVVVAGDNLNESKFYVDDVSLDNNDIYHVTELVTNVFQEIYSTSGYRHSLKYYFKKGTTLQNKRPRGAIGGTTYICPIKSLDGESNYSGNFIDYINVMQFNLGSFYGKITLPFDCVVNIPFETGRYKPLSSIDTYIMPFYNTDGSQNLVSYGSIFRLNGIHTAGFGSGESFLNNRNPLMVPFKAGTVLGLRKNGGSSNASSTDNIYIAPLIAANTDTDSVIPTLSISLSDFIANESKTSFNQMGEIYTKLSTYVDDLNFSITKATTGSELISKITLAMQIKANDHKIYGVKTLNKKRSFIMPVSGGKAKITCQSKSIMFTSTATAETKRPVVSISVTGAQISKLKEDQINEIHNNTYVYFSPFEFELQTS